MVDEEHEDEQQADNCDVTVQGLDEAARNMGRVIGQLIGGIVVLFLVLAAFAIIVATPAAFTYIVWKSDPGTITPSADAGYLDLIFSNRWVVWSARLMLYVAAFALLMLGIYIVASIVTRIKNRQWLRSAGGFHADVGQLQADLSYVDDLLELVDEAQTEKDQLADKLGMITDELELVTAERDALAARVAVLETERTSS